MKTFVTAMLGLMALCSIANAQTADTVYTGGKIYTVNEEQPWAEAVAITDGKFIKVGSADDVKPMIGDDTKVVDFIGKFVMPGLIAETSQRLGASVVVVAQRLKVRVADKSIDNLRPQRRQLLQDASLSCLHLGSPYIVFCQSRELGRIMPNTATPRD